MRVGVSGPCSADEYQDALAALQTTISGKKRAAPKGPDDLTWEQQFERLRVYLDRLGMTEATDGLSVIHVAGTKGKGSTCAFVEHVLRENGTRTGLYSSPHLVDIRERFRIDGKPVSKTVFVRNFWWMYDKLKETCEPDLGMPAYFRFLTLLGFRIFAQEKVDAVVLEVGLGGRLDATNVVKNPVVCGVTSLGLDHVEVLGGARCTLRRLTSRQVDPGTSENIRPRPFRSLVEVCAPTRPSTRPSATTRKHETLSPGDTLAKIAREKAGIFKPGVPAFTSPQSDEAMQSLRTRAEEVGAPLSTVTPLAAYEGGEGPITLGLAGPHQELNAALAIQLLRTWATRAPSPPAWGYTAEETLASGTLPATWRAGLGKTEWWGRAQVVVDETAVDTADGTLPAYEESGDEPAAAPSVSSRVTGASNLTFYLDGAHTEESMRQCAEWFCAATKKGKDASGLAPLRLLLFNCMEERDPTTLLSPLAQVLAEREAPLNQPAIFAPSESSSKGLVPFTGPLDNTTWQAGLAHTWNELARKHSGCTTMPAADDGALVGEGGSGRVAAAVTPPTSSARGPGGSFEATAGVVVPCLRHALERIRLRAAEERRLKSGRCVHVLVTGSLYLVGDMLRLLGRAG